MKLYEIAYPTEGGDEIEILTEEEILQYYYSYWSTKMLLNDPSADISRERCLQDWSIVHWAREIRIPI